MLTKAEKYGDCEVCDAVNVLITTEHGNIVMCSSCRDKELTAIARSNAAKQIIEVAKNIDTSIQVVQDIFNARTVAAVELQAAIQNDDSIPAEQKNYAFVKACEARMVEMQKLVFATSQLLTDQQQEMQMWRVNAQTHAAKLRAEIREKEFKHLDIQYDVKATRIRDIKPTTVKKSKTSFNKTELYAAARKYDVPAPQVQTIIVSKGITAEAAAKFLAELMGKI